MYLSVLGWIFVAICWWWSVYGQYKQGWNDGYFKGLTRGRHEGRRDWGAK